MQQRVRSKPHSLEAQIAAEKARCTEQLAAAPDGPDTLPLVSARAAPIISRSSPAERLKGDGVAGSAWKDPRESQLFLTESFPFS